MSIILKKLSIEAFCYGTENEEKVIAAIKNLIPEESEIVIQPILIKLKGHFNNPITRIIVNIEGHKEVYKILQYILDNLDNESKTEILQKLELMIDPTGIFYLRLNKQSTFNRIFSVKTEVGSVLRVKVQISKKGPASKKDFLTFYKSIINHSKFNNIN
ncbi:MAG: RNA-binding domain-containing protein [Candidatus Odinarchaeia archaeon]